MILRESIKETQRTWDVLLIGGASGTGKTSVSYPLARHYGVAIAEIDDFHHVLRTMTTPEQQPVLHYWHTHPEAVEWPAERILELHLEVAQVMAPALEAVIANHLESQAPVVLEGDYMLPALAALNQFGDIQAEGRVCGVFLYEPDERQLVRNYLNREPQPGEQNKRARVSWFLGQWLKEDAERHGVAAIPARPWETLLTRIVAAIETPRDGNGS